jgi:hypothetical protein
MRKGGTNLSRYNPFRRLFPQQNRTQRQREPLQTQTQRQWEPQIDENEQRRQRQRESQMNLLATGRILEDATIDNLPTIDINQKDKMTAFDLYSGNDEDIESFFANIENDDKIVVFGNQNFFINKQMCIKNIIENQNKLLAIKNKIEYVKVNPIGLQIHGAFVPLSQLIFILGNSHRYWSIVKDLDNIYSFQRVNYIIHKSPKKSSLKKSSLKKSPSPKKNNTRKSSPKNSKIGNLKNHPYLQQYNR